MFFEVNLGEAKAQEAETLAEETLNQAVFTLRQYHLKPLNA